MNATNTKRAAALANKCGNFSRVYVTRCGDGSAMIGATFNGGKHTTVFSTIATPELAVEIVDAALAQIAPGMSRPTFTR